MFVFRYYICVKLIYYLILIDEGYKRRTGFKRLVSPRELADLLVHAPTELRTVATQTSPGVRVTRSLWRQTSPEL